LKKLTARQQQFLDFIREYIRNHSFPPSIREIQGHFGLRSTKGVKDHIDRLVDYGYLKRVDGAARALEVVGSRGTGEDRVPLVGTVAAGLPILADENIEDYLPVPSGPLRTRGMFYLRVSGDSMVGAAILEGDLVLVRPQPFVEQGEIAVVRIGDEATVKRFFKFRDRIELHSENPKYDPIVCRQDDEEIRVIGRVAAVFRELE
jgi:repressor LexA